MNKKLLNIIFVFFSFLFYLPNAHAASVLDQSFVREGGGGLSALINECCQYIAQTFTAGRTGKLDSVHVDIQANRTTLDQLRVSIWSTYNGIPQNIF